MKYAFSLLIALSLTGFGTAQEPGPEELIPKPKWTKEQIENPPARDLKVDLRESESYLLPLRELNRAAVDGKRPGVEERQYLAIVQFAVPAPEGSQKADWSRYLERAKLPMGRFDDAYLLLPNVSNRTIPQPNLTQLKYLLTQAPDGKLDKDTIAFFQSENVDRGLFYFINRRDFADGTRRQEFRIFGKSAEECERCIKGLLTMLDYGFSRPLQLQLLQKREEIADEVKTLKTKLDESELQLEQVNKRLAEFKEFTAEMLPMLRQQQMALDVDLAGTMARIKACEKLLENTRPALSNERRASVEDTKIQAEINLAGFQAQRITLLDFVVKVKEMNDLGVRQLELVKTISKSRLAVRSGPQRCLEIDADIEFLGPVKVIDNKFVVQPVKWTEQ